MELWYKDNFVISDEIIEIFCTKYPVDKRYKLDELVLKEYVPRLVHKNSSLEEIYIVVTLINAFYSTRMGADDCYKLARLLWKRREGIMEALDAGDKQVVESIVMEQIISKTSYNNKQKFQNNEGKQENADSIVRVAFSFTTKYFSILSRYLDKGDNFPIYDNLVAGLLDFYYRKEGKNLVSATNKNYMAYCEYIDKLGVRVSYKKLDHYLWTLGRKIRDQCSHLSEDEYYMLMKKVPRKTRRVEQKNLAGKSVKYSIKIGSNISVEAMKRILLHVFPGELD